MKRRNIFYETLENIGDNLYKSATFLEAELKKDKLEVGPLAKTMKDYEHTGDQYSHIIIKELNKTFLPPLESQDILALASSLDDVLDGMEAFAARLEMYNIEAVDNYMIQFAENITKNCYEISTAMRELPSKKLLRLREHTMKINELENEADQLYRKSVRELFTDVKDPIHLVKLKDLYEILEETTDFCEDVADTLETIIMTNS